MSISLKNPSPEETSLINNFATLIAQAMELVAEHELGPVGGMIVQKLQEAMLWHGYALANKDAPSPEEMN